ncbi:MAG: ABC transporter ATP-binding protein [Hyphomicrobiales bacterium]|nr:ABC transporter ATP-binding protein [Hyphomicrobiales bacterium]
MPPIIAIKNLSKTYDNGHRALIDVSLDIDSGEILALLGPNGAGKTSLISIICGIVTPGSGNVEVDGHDVITGYRHTRRIIGLVPQEISLEPFSTVFNTVAFTRGLFGKASDRKYIEKILRQLSLWDKKDEPIMNLSGGMKRRVLIAKALSHEPRILFLDEPSAGVDVELRKEMWEIVRALQRDGVTIILTTHYIEEAEAIAERIGIINDGYLLLVEDKTTLMKQMGRKQMMIELQCPLENIPDGLDTYGLELAEDGKILVFNYDITDKRTGITALLKDLNTSGVLLKDVQTKQSSLEEIFVNLVKDKS